MLEREETRHSGSVALVFVEEREERSRFRAGWGMCGRIHPSTLGRQDEVCACKEQEHMWMPRSPGTNLCYTVGHDALEQGSPVVPGVLHLVIPDAH